MTFRNCLIAAIGEKNRQVYKIARWVAGFTRVLTRRNLSAAKSCTTHCDKNHTKIAVLYMQVYYINPNKVLEKPNLHDMK